MDPDERLVVLRGSDLEELLGRVLEPVLRQLADLRKLVEDTHPKKKVLAQHGFLSNDEMAAALGLCRSKWFEVAKSIKHLQVGKLWPEREVMDALNKS